MGCGASTGRTANEVPLTIAEERRGSVRRPAVSAEATGDRQAGVGQRKVVRTSVRQSVQLNASTVVAQYEKGPDTLKVLSQATDGNPLFAPLSADQRSVVYGAMFEVHCATDEVIIKEGDRGDLFYVVQSGEYAAYLAKNPSKAVMKYGVATGFGELALLYNSPRAATVKCLKGGKLWAIDRAVFNMVVVASNQKELFQTQEFLRSIDILSDLSPANLTTVSALFEETFHAIGDEVWTKGDTVDALFILKEGEIELNIGTIEEGEGVADDSGSFSRNSSTNKRQAIHIRQGEYFGTDALDTSTDATHLVTGLATCPVTVLVLRRSSIRSAKAEVLQDLPQLLAARAALKAQRSLDTFTSLQPAQRLRLLRNVPSRKHPIGEAITTLGSEHKPRSLHVLVAGEAKASPSTLDNDKSDHEILEAGDIFGQEGFKSDMPYAQTVEAAQSSDPDEAVPEVLVATLNNDMLNALGSSMSKVIRRSDVISEGALRQTEFEPKDLKVTEILGTGGYGSVKLCLHTPSKDVYALKLMSKAKIMAKRQVEHVNNERKLLALCNHPLIIELVASYQDHKNLYLLLELTLGGELFSYLDWRGPLPVEEARFYAANVESALEYMHDRNIAYRDLKPENLMIDSQGYLKLVDFGFAKTVTSHERTWTLCGTPEYLAPEVILRKGHDMRVDWWSLGILLFELLMGTTPFFMMDHFDIFKKIIQGLAEGQLSAITDKPTESLIRGFLRTEPSARLGSSPKGGGREVREHPFFADVDFLKLVRKELKPPYIPRIDSSTDTRHCAYEAEDGEVAAEEEKEQSQRTRESITAMFVGFAEVTFPESTGVNN